MKLMFRLWCSRPGKLLTPDAVMACLSAGQSDAGFRRINSPDASSMNQERTYEQDPQYGLNVLSEAAQRALSPSINDPGTAISVMVMILRLLTKPQPECGETRYDRFVYHRRRQQPMGAANILPIARDGAGAAEVGLTMQKVLAGIAASSQDPHIAASAQIPRMRC